MSALNVVALISGGKDSLFSILHLLANGHNVVALANLHPPLLLGSGASDDLDSFMYQTIGHRVIPLFEQALGLPLYRQEIAGSAIDQRKSYHHGHSSAFKEDETESLIPLLRRVLAAHPEVNAISTGAILSDYQRTRVESVALRLGLTPLAYLWQWSSLSTRPESSLLEDMGRVGQDARIIKVASGGLDESFLWRNVAEADTITKLVKAAERFGTTGDGAVLGEGGEYETLAIRGPPPLWKAAIEIPADRRATVAGEAGTFSLQLGEPTLSNDIDSSISIENLSIPPLLDDRSLGIMGALAGAHTGILPGAANLSPLKDNTQPVISPIRSAIPGLYSGLVAQGANAGAQTLSVMQHLTSLLAQDDQALSMADIAYTSIILRDMADFGEVNRVYGSYFTQPNPPARVTVACPDVLSEGAQVMLGFTVSPKAAERVGLHVQSWSYWAPANIGPYSQAVAIPVTQPRNDQAAQVVYVAGQIPLVPASMQLCKSAEESWEADFTVQTVLALQHMTRVGDAMRVRYWVAAVVFIRDGPDMDKDKVAGIVERAWIVLHAAGAEAQIPNPDEDDNFDVWHVKQKPWSRYTSGEVSQNPSRLTETPPLWIIRAAALPRGASIEWVGYGATDQGISLVHLEHLHYLLSVFKRQIVKTTTRVS